VEGLPILETNRLLPAYGTLMYDVTREHPACEPAD